MIRGSMVAAMARAEIRSVRRLIRYWVFSGLSVLLTLLIFLYYGALHGFASRFSATIGAVGPRYLMSAMGMYVLVIFLVGMIFLAFDIRARDERERMAEVLDSRPMSNTELLVGRGLGLVWMAWLPALFIGVVLQLLGGLALLFDWFMLEPIEPHSMVSFLLDSMAGFALWCALVMLLAVTLRNRMLVVLAALAFFGMQIWLIFRMPLYLQPAFGLFSGFYIASDLAPSFGGLPGLIKRVGVWVLAGGLVSLAAAFHPRPDGGSKSKRLAVGGALAALGLLLMMSLAWQGSRQIEDRQVWRAAHEERSDEPRADLREIVGSVRIVPGRRVELDLNLVVAGPGGSEVEQLLFTLNPGLEPVEASLAGQPLEWTHADGLLEIELPRSLGRGEEMALELRAAGTPDTFFGYLDSEKDLLSGTFMDGQLALLGIETMIFDSGYTALLPGGFWLPSSGTAVPTSDPATHPRDFFEIDLEVDVPSGWLVAGPGRRESVGGSEVGTRFRFHPGAPVPFVGLLAARFERRAIEVEGVELELLTSAKHNRNTRFFADAAEALTDRLTEIFGEARQLGIPYPYGALTLVESPTGLRGYGGGWRMDTTQSLPGVLLLRENSFPTSRFEFGFRNEAAFEEREGGIGRAKLEVMERFFENDFSGGNLFLGGSRNFLLYQTSATGEGASAIDFVLDELVNQLLTGKRGYFSVYLFDQQSGFVIGETITEMIAGRSDSVLEALLKAATDKPSVWDRALDTSLADLDPGQDPSQALNLLALKSGAIARTILDGLGRERTAELLAELLARYRGRHFDAPDLNRVAENLEIDLEAILGDWLHETALPGFLASPVEIVRLADDDRGQPRYQTRFHVLNDEPAPGLLRVRWLTSEGEGKEPRTHESEPYRLPGGESLEIGLSSSSPPSEVWLAPYLALNRQDSQLTLPRVDERQQVAEEPFLGARPSDWRPPPTPYLVVDDLDEGFSVRSAESDSGVRLQGGLSSFFRPQVDMDQGLPEFLRMSGPPEEWARQEFPSAFGRYRRTLALVRKGDGDQTAVFEARLPHPGRWQLEFHLPVVASETETVSGPGLRVDARSGFGGRLGTYDIRLVSGDETYPLDFDASAAQDGWNSLGEFDLGAGSARVEVSDETSGRVVVVDAIRWHSLEDGG